MFEKWDAEDYTANSRLNESMDEISRVMECDVAIIGGGLGGVAAALMAAQLGIKVILTEETSWLGGQVTSQAVSALDEHRFIETFCGTGTYCKFRRSVRKYYEDKYQVPSVMPDGSLLNPGNGWVSRLCFEPKVGLRVINDMLMPYVKEGKITILTDFSPLDCRSVDQQIQSVQLINCKGEKVELLASYYLDATELGDLLPLAGLSFTTGAEAFEETREVHASKEGAHFERIQSFTTCFMVEYCPNENHTIRKPVGYEYFKENQPFSLTLYTHEGEPVYYNFSEKTTERPLPFWTYRRLFNASLFRSARKLNDVALINWDSNDYRGRSLLDKDLGCKKKALREARQLSLGFLYWLQTEVKRDDGKGYGYPELKILPSAVGTQDGLAKMPYIREARRIRGLYRIVEQDISAEANPDRTQISFFDSVGIGWYSIDLHPCVGYQGTLYAPTLPFQIPLGALIPQDCDNLIASCKNISTTHITNGAYRLHPVEWSIGTAAGALAAFCCQQNSKPRQVRENVDSLTNFQQLLTLHEVKIEWDPNLLIKEV
jgi:hypothetical protein